MFGETGSTPGADYALDFVGNRYIVDGIEVPASSAFSFARTSAAAMADKQGRWQHFAAGSLRRISGLGALIEPAATNLVRASEVIGGPGWTTPPAQLSRSGNAQDGWQFTVNTAYSGFLTIEQSFTAIATGNVVHLAFDLHDSGLGKAGGWTRR